MVHILLIQLLPQQFHCLAKPLEVDYLPFPKELDDIVYIRIVRQPQDVVIGDPGFLLGTQILAKIRHRISLNLHGGSSPREAGGSSWVNSDSVIHKIGSKGAVLDLGILQISGQLMNNCTNHLQMTKFFRAHIYDKKAPNSEDQFKSCEFAVILR